MKTWTPKYKNPVYCIKGLHQAVNAMLLLSEDVYYDDKSEKKFILTRRCITDPLENTFSTIKSHGGNNRLPSIHEVSYILGKIISRNIRIFHEKTKNCENDVNESLNERFLVNDDLELDKDEIETNENLETATNVNIDNDFLTDTNLGQIIRPFEVDCDYDGNSEEDEENSENESGENSDNDESESNQIYLDLSSCFADKSSIELLVIEEEVEEYCKTIELNDETVENTSLRYVIGFVLHKQFKNKIICEECPSKLSSTDFNFIIQSPSCS